MLLNCGSVSQTSCLFLLSSGVFDRVTWTVYRALPVILCAARNLFCASLRFYRVCVRFVVCDTTLRYK